ncbi:NAD(P)-dependent oxidoreductase [Bradyrhizobium sp. CIAT3101]|uniref:NAD(P)-dependent oxidoreductase n=1 Tax=Bradyrhizobium sp. CIAT3101 TaxID=439387 RepID=UPI0024B24540|nr:NAD(P)-dependent oxidoreductase [Bradyrhizobium sp. CIAT3101]WFU78108.1 NAD(P)-dependent oxidoreductase [Bradyrhizobium sp. CIAT3101]
MAVVGVVGLGNMGRGMALSLKRAGHEVLGTDASAAARSAIAAEGIAVFEGVGPLCARADLLVLSLPTAEIVEAVVAGPGGVIAHARPGLRVVDTSTSHPDTTRRLAASLAAQGMAMIDAPVSGGPKGAITATMTMVIGGADDDVAAVEPILSDMSAKRVHVGSVGAGHVCKIINNLLCAAHLLTAAEAMRIARDAEVDPARLLEGLNAGSGRSGVTLVNLPTWILNGAFDSGFTMALMRKDVRLATQLIAKLALDLPIAQETARIWSESAGSIGDGEDFNRIVELQLGRM